MANGKLKTSDRLTILETEMRMIKKLLTGLILITIGQTGIILT